MIVNHCLQPIFLIQSAKYLQEHCIPDICYFFTLAKFLENKIYTEKRQFFALNL